MTNSIITTETESSQQEDEAAAKGERLVTVPAVLIVLDCDDRCPGLGPELLKRAHAMRHDVPCLVVLAYREFEAWFIAAVTSLHGQFDLPNSLTVPPYLDGLRDAKGWLGKHMTTGYDPITCQPKVVATR